MICLFKKDFAAELWKFQFDLFPFPFFHLDIEPSNDPHVLPPTSHMHFIHDCLTNNNKNVSINLNWNCQAREREGKWIHANFMVILWTIIFSTRILIPRVNRYIFRSLICLTIHRGQILCAWDLFDVEMEAIS